MPIYCYNGNGYTSFALNTVTGLPFVSAFALKKRKKVRSILETIMVGFAGGLFQDLPCVAHLQFVLRNCVAAYLNHSLSEAGRRFLVCR